MLDKQERLEELERVLAALAHAARLHILLVVQFHGGTMSAGDIAGRFSHSWPTTSRHLRVLEQAGLLQFVRQGRTRVYRVNNQQLEMVRSWLRWFEQPQRVVSGAPPAVHPEIILRDIALAYPETHEDFTDGERALKVRNRTFMLLRADGGGLKMSVRLPLSRADALKNPFAEPIQYKLGKSEWITASFGSNDELPLELLWEWIDESYRALAPRRLLAALPAPPPVPQAPAGR